MQFPKSLPLALATVCFSFAPGISAAAQAPPAARTPPAADIRSPRSALDAFLTEQLEAEPDWARVGGTLALPADADAADIEQIASRLKSVLDARGLLVVMGSVPSDPEYREPETGLARFVPFPGRLPGFSLLRGPDLGWRISPDTVLEADALYESTFSWFARRLLATLPPVFERSFLGFTLWAAIGFLVLIAAGWLLRLLLLRLLARVVAPIVRRRSLWLGDGVQELAGPTAAFAGVAFARHLIPDLRFPVGASHLLVLLLTVALAVIGVWAALRAVEVASRVFQRIAERTETDLDDQLVGPVRTVLRIAATLTAVLILAESYGYSITTLVAGLGLGGLAVALAAQDTLANLLGWAAVIVDRPFTVGDWVLVGDTEGTVEQVGLRATRIRTFYDSVISVPNRSVANAVVDNMGQRKYRRMKQMVALRHDTDPDRMHAFVEGIRNVVRANEKMRHDYFEIHVNRFSESSVDVLVYCFFRVDDWHEELTERHNFILEVMRLARALDIRFAVPARNLNLESAPGQIPPERPAPDAAALSETVAAFGPGNGRSRPKPPA